MLTPLSWRASSMSSSHFHLGLPLLLFPSTLTAFKFLGSVISTFYRHASVVDPVKWFTVVYFEFTPTGHISYSISFGFIFYFPNIAHLHFLKFTFVFFCNWFKAIGPSGNNPLSVKSNLSFFNIYFWLKICFRCFWRIDFLIQSFHSSNSSS